MEPELKLFEFKSHMMYWWREQNDTKNNTIRKIDFTDDRFLDLIAWNQIGYNDGDIKIKISCGNASIVRNIRDICIWNDLMIITWHPEKKLLTKKEEDLLEDILGHVSVDDDEMCSFRSLKKKLKNIN